MEIKHRIDLQIFLMKAEVGDVDQRQLTAQVSDETLIGCD
jgi:hypothetical protein